MAQKIVAAILGFIAGVLIYPWFDLYVLALIAFIGAIAVGILVYMLVLRAFAELNV